MSLLSTYMRARISEQSLEQRETTLYASAYWGPLNPGLLGASENPKPGRLGATTWKLG